MSAPNAFGRRLLHEYSGVRDDEIESHLEAVVSLPHYPKLLVCANTLLRKRKPSKWQVVPILP